MREFAQALGGELKRRAELLGPLDFAAWHARHADSRPGRTGGRRRPASWVAASADRRGGAAERRGDLDSPASGTLRLRPAPPGPGPDAGPPLPRLVVLVDDFDALVVPALGCPGRPAAGSVVRALEAVARDGERLGVHLVATSARPDRTEDTELARGRALRIVLDAPVAAPGRTGPGPGRLGHPDGRVTPFQGGGSPAASRVRRRCVPPSSALEWERMGDPPTRRPVRELGNGPTDLALLASALERAARSVTAAACRRCLFPACGRPRRSTRPFRPRRNPPPSTPRGPPTAARVPRLARLRSRPRPTSPHSAAPPGSA